MKLRLVLTLFFVSLAFGALWDAHDTLAAPAHTETKGVALDDWSHMADLTTLGVSEYYGWGWDCAGAAHCINMDRNWTLPLPACDATVLLGNEPTNPEPAGHPIDAGVVASVTVAIEQQCPQTALVVANINTSNEPGGADAVAWLSAYYSAYQTQAGHALTETVGLHCYAYDAPTCESDVSAALALNPGLRYWITETNIVEFYPDAAQQFAALLTWYALQPQIDRVYAFTNRGPDSAWLNLVADDGTLTPSGQAFHDWPAQSWQSYIPLAEQGYP